MTVTDLPQKERQPREPRFRLPSTRTLVAVAVAALLGLVGIFLAALITGRDAQEKVADTAPAVLTLDVLCKRNDQLGADLRTAGACGDKIDKAKSAVDGQPQPTVAAAGLSRDDVTAIVAGQLAGKTVTVEQVTALVTQVYNANRPKDAPPPTGDQVLAAVQQVCGSTKCQGPPGRDGDPAPPVTGAEIFAQVSAYCSGDDAPCKGRPGDTGPQGVSVVDQRFVRDEQGTCRNQVTLSDGRVLDGGPAGDAACPPAAPPTTPTS